VGAITICSSPWRKKAFWKSWKRLFGGKGMTLTFVLGIINYEAVLIFGIIVSVAFAGVEASRKNYLGVFFFTVGATLLQLTMFAIYGRSFTAKLYPFIIHIPLVLFLTFYYKRPLLMSFSAVWA
jgi:two-component system sensor histidine kinase AgrC